MYLNFAEFIYPANWVGDQMILYNQVKKAEQQRSTKKHHPSGISESKIFNHNIIVDLV
jgi:hypothetical protein